MSSDKETDDADREICELLDPKRIAELELHRIAEMDSDLNRGPERKRNIVKRQISFNKKNIYRYVSLGCEDPNQNFALVTSGPSAATNQDPFRILICHKSGKQYEVDLNRLISLTSDRFICRFCSVVNNIDQTWINICDLQPIVEETISAFRIFSSSEGSNQNDQKASGETNETIKNSLLTDDVQSQDLKEKLSIEPLNTEGNKDSPNQVLQETVVPSSKELLSIDTVRNILDLPRSKLCEDLCEIETLIAAKSFDQIIFSNFESQYLSDKVEGGKSLSTATESCPGTETQSSTSTKVESFQQYESSVTENSDSSEIEIQSSTNVDSLQQSESSGTGSSFIDIEVQSSVSSKIETLAQKNEKISEPPTEKIKVKDIPISSPFGQILNDALAKLDSTSCQAEPFFQTLVDNLAILPYPGDQDSSKATIKAIEYNLNHRILKFHKDVPRLQRNIVNFFNRIECLVRKWPLNTGIRTLKQYLAFVLDMDLKITKFNLLSLRLKSKIEFDRLDNLSGRSNEKNESSDCSLSLYKKYYLAVKYISCLEEVRSLSEKFYSYIVKPLPSFLV